MGAAAGAAPGAGAGHSPVWAGPCQGRPHSPASLLFHFFFPVASFFLTIDWFCSLHLFLNHGRGRRWWWLDSSNGPCSLCIPIFSSSFVQALRALQEGMNHGGIKLFGLISWAGRGLPAPRVFLWVAFCASEPWWEQDRCHVTGMVLDLSRALLGMLLPPSRLPPCCAGPVLQCPPWQGGRNPAVGFVFFFPSSDPA